MISQGGQMILATGGAAGPYLEVKMLTKLSQELLQFTMTSELLSLEKACFHLTSLFLGKSYIVFHFN
jgi:hypothetical protein